MKINISYICGIYKYVFFNGLIIISILNGIKVWLTLSCIAWIRSNI